MADALRISIRHNLFEIERKLDRLAKQQIPFATAQALTSLAKMVRDAETARMRALFDKPTPFTVNSVGVKAARKSWPEATVFMKDLAAVYLEPFEFSGKHHLTARALLNPKNVGLNAYGNIPRRKLAQLKGRKDVFIGSVTFKKTGETVSGVWQRPDVGARSRKRGYSGERTGYGTIGNTQNRIGGQRIGLKLLIRFGEALEVKQHLGWRSIAKSVVEKNFNAVFGRALARAIATAK